MRYRPVYFLPDPMMGDWKIPVAALLERDAGVEVVIADLLPDARAAGGAAAHHLVQREVRALKRLAVFDSLRGIVGNTLVLGEICSMAFLPGQDPAQWLRENVLPRSVSTSDASLAE